MIHYQIVNETDRLWIKEEFSPEFELKTESIFAQCNGYMGVRAAHPFKVIEEQRGMFVSGVFNKAYENEVTELVNCPDLTWFEVEVDGEKLYPERAHFLSGTRKLDLYTGELVINYEFKLISGKKVLVENRRAASFDQKHLFMQKLAITVEGKENNELKIKTGINGQQTNSGVSHFSSATARVYDKQMMEISCELEDNTVTVDTICNIKNGIEQKKEFILGRRKITGVYHIETKADETITFEKLSCVDQTEDNIFSSDRKQMLLDGMEKGYEVLFEEHQTEMKHYWADVAIEVDGMTNEEKAAVYFAQYHILGMTPWHTSFSSIAAKGLTGEGYKGHVFWDTEIFILPYLLYTYPEEARRLLEYRYHGLNGARKKAKAYGFEGAMFPWEAAKSGEEETPLYAALNIHTGKANKVWSGIKEYHVTADIIYALERYYQVTNDQQFMNDYGYEMAFETAKFWVSCAKWDDKHQKYGIYDVIGPDEYTEHVDNNAYTNHMAVYCVKKASEYALDVKENNPKLYEELDTRLNVEAQLDKWKEFQEKMLIQEVNEDQIIPQDDTFLSKPCLPDIMKYKTSQIKQAVLRDYSREEVVNMQVLKQADVVMMLNLFPQLYDEEIVKKNVLFYEERTIHDSSLSYCAHAQACAAIGAMDLAWKFFEHCLMIDIDDNPYDSNDGIHSASLGGIWNCLILGFAGVHYEDNVLYLNPHLPEHWKNMKFSLVISGEKVSFDISDKEIILVKAGDCATEIKVKISDNYYLLKDRLEI